MDFRDYFVLEKNQQPMQLQILFNRIKNMAVSVDLLEKNKELDIVCNKVKP